MAVTITRTPWIDDDGTGTTGTVINNAEKTALYNQIDAALAQLLPLAGGSIAGGVSVAGNMNIAGLFGATGFGQHFFQASGTGAQQLLIRNLAAGTGNFAQLLLGNDTNPNLVNVYAFASNYATSGDTAAAGGTLRVTGPGGLALSVTDPAGSIRSYTSGLERMRIGAGGEVLINSVSNPFGAQLHISTDGSTRPNGIAVQNLSGTMMNFFAFTNSAGGVAGLIQQTSATTVTYLTTSDRRLKTDRGRATDLAGLRAVVVHDFEWTADGRPDRGVFAQEAIAVFPRAIAAGGDDPTTNPWGADYSKFVADLIVGFQEHDAAIAALRRDLSYLKG